MKRLFILGGMTQERIVLALAILLFAVASAALRGFLTGDNLIVILRSVSVLGILAVGMAIVIIGRGIDLSAVAIMAMSTAWYLELLNRGLPDGAVVSAAGEAYTIVQGRAFRWTARGYKAARGVPRIDGLLTPPSTLLAMGAGYRPVLHPDAQASPMLDPHART